jgi:hypothetical protein
LAAGEDVQAVKACRLAVSDLGRHLEQNHDNRAPKGFVQGIDFLRKSIPCGFDLGYIYRDFAIKLSNFVQILEMSR